MGGAPYLFFFKHNTIHIYSDATFSLKIHASLHSALHVCLAE